MSCIKYNKQISASVLMLCIGSVCAQEFPAKPIRLVTAGAGGGTDFIARLIAQGLTDAFAQQIIVDNRGGSGNVASEFVDHAPPDGYTLLFTAGSHWIGPLIDNAPYDAVKDFSSVSLATKSPNVLVIHASLPVKSVKDLIALAKAKPGELNYASSATGSSSHLAMELFKAMAGVDIVRIPYKVGATETTDLLTGRVQITFGTAASMTPLLKLGKLKALAVTSAAPTALFPGLPTMAAAGVPGYESTSTTAMFAPAKTPPSVINRIYLEIPKILNAAAIKEKLLKAGVEGVGGSPAELDATVKSDIIKWAKVIKAAGIRTDG